jgi:predicted enzyme related to lactoylglutathione lyase
MPRVVHFEIIANDPEKTVTFYNNVFGWKITKWEGPQEYWLVETGETEGAGINGGIFRSNEVLSGTVNSVDVKDIDAYIEKVKQQGGEIVVEKHAIPGVGYNAYCKDVEGTLFGIHEENPAAQYRGFDIGCSRSLRLRKLRSGSWLKFFRYLSVFRKTYQSLIFPTDFIHNLICLRLIGLDQCFFSFSLPAFDLFFVVPRLFFGIKFAYPNKFDRAARFCIGSGNRSRLVLF